MQDCHPTGAVPGRLRPRHLARAAGCAGCGGVQGEETWEPGVAASGPCGLTAQILNKASSCLPGLPTPKVIKSPSISRLCFDPQVGGQQMF